MFERSQRLASEIDCRRIKEMIFEKYVNSVYSGAHDIFGREIHVGDWIAYPVGLRTQYKAMIRIARVMDVIPANADRWSIVKVKGIRYFGKNAEATQMTYTKSVHKGIVLNSRDIPKEYKRLIKLPKNTILKCLKK